jgi:hypothetical protein
MTDFWIVSLNSVILGRRARLKEQARDGIPILTNAFL